jgi:putative oxidoreductase
LIFSLNVGVWIAQGMLAAMFGMAGMMKSTRPMDVLAEKMTFVPDYRPSTIRFIGVAEVRRDPWHSVAYCRG